MRAARQRLTNGIIIAAMAKRVSPLESERREACGFALDLFYVRLEELPDMLGTRSAECGRFSIYAGQQWAGHTDGKHVCHTDLNTRFPACGQASAASKSKAETPEKRGNHLPEVVL